MTIEEDMEELQKFLTEDPLDVVLVCVHNCNNSTSPLMNRQFDSLIRRKSIGNGELRRTDAQRIQEQIDLGVLRVVKPFYSPDGVLFTP